MSISTSRRWKMKNASGALAVVLTVVATGCLDGLDPPFDAEATELECSSDRDGRYLSAAGSVADNGVALSDGHPPPPSTCSTRMPTNPGSPSSARPRRATTTSTS